MKTRQYRFGVEIEVVINRDNKVECMTQLEALEAVNVTTDGSIQYDDGECGIEIRVGVLTLSDMEVRIKQVCEILNRHNCRVNKTTGLHVHISNKRFFISKQLANILKTWIAIEDVLISTQPRSRFSNQYCRRQLAKVIKNSSKITSYKDKQDFKDQFSSYDRYMTLNLNSLYKHGTLECRLHSGTTEAKKINNWLNLILSVFDYALDRYDPVKIKTLFEMSTSEDKINKVFELLSVDKSLIEFYNARISKFLLPNLAIQQEAAVKYMAIKPELNKLEKKANDMQNVLSSKRREADRFLCAFNM